VLPIGILLVVGAALLRTQGDSWPVVAAKLVAAVVPYLVARSVVFGVVVVGRS
jgi:hypothetical protein